ncbi:MAG TPA: IPT/TIG domain-containing protein, partial [Ktedonobacterales bacterium]|nr:IPT/TIG domain-containing protein [Ktedonobacterales bacterium]
TSVAISGSHLTDATSVKFNGTAASFTVNSDTSITATVPTGATTGPISVGNQEGSATSATTFQPGAIWIPDGSGGVTEPVAIWTNVGSGPVKIAGVWVPNGSGVKRIW